MSEKNNYIPLREFFSESLLRDLILFLFLFLLIIAQDWPNIFLLLFPLVALAFSIFFRMINDNKWRTEFDNSRVIYNPLGFEKKHANRLNFCALLQLILLFWIGAESLYHPQLIDNYFIFFIAFLIFFYTFGFYWIFLDLWKNSRIEILLQGTGINYSMLNDKRFTENLDGIISFLKIKNYKKISMLNFIIFIILNLLNIALAFLTINNFFVGSEYYLPGTGIEDSKPINLPSIIYVILFIPPIITIIFLKIIYKDINDYSKEKLNKVIEPLPKNIQIKIFENLKALNRKFKEELRKE